MRRTKRCRLKTSSSNNTGVFAPRPAIPRSPTTPKRRRCSALLDAENTAGVKLTESFAMWPGSSVSGLYFSHAESFYFGVGKIERDQVEDYAARKGWSVDEAERWLAPVLNYIPTQDQSAQDRRVKEAMPTQAPSSAAPANDIDLEGNAGAPAGLQLRGASGVAQEGGKGGIGEPPPIPPPTSPDSPPPPTPPHRKRGEG